MTKRTYKKGIKVFQYDSKDFCFSREKRIDKGKFKGFFKELRDIKNNNTKEQAEKN